MEVAHHERDVDVARLAHGLAGVQSLQDREETRVPVQPARQRVEEAGPRVSAEA